MSRFLDSCLIYLSVWFRELKHDVKELLKSRLKLALSFFFAFLFMSLMFVGFYRIVNYVKDTPIIGLALVGRLISLVFLSLFIMLIYSSIITAFSTLFFSRDNNFLITSPLNLQGVLMGKLLQTTFYSSWMSFIIIIPLLGVLGIIFKLQLLSYVIISTAIIFYFLSASTIGSILVLFIVKIFPARKVRDLFVLGLVALGTSMYILFRMMNLEQILRPGQESLATSYLRFFELPKTMYITSYWLSGIIIEFVNTRSGWVKYFFVVSAIMLVSVVIYYILAKLFFYSGWEKVQSEEKKRYVSNKFSKNAVLAKDVRTFFRDTRQWTQLLLVFAIIVIYIFNIYKMPLDIPYVHYLIAFLNIGMVGFVIASIGLRFSYSSISLEGRYFWLILASPFNRKKLFIQKYVENLIPVLVIAMVLVIVSNLILKPPGMLNILSIVTVFVASVTITSLGIGMGALYPKFDAVNPAEVETSWGGVIYMIYSFFYISITLALEAVWVRMYFVNMIRGIPVYYPLIIGILTILILINIIANVVPLKMGLNRMEKLEFTV